MIHVGPTTISPAAGDSTALLQTAFANGGHILLASGLFTVSKVLLLEKLSNVTINGSPRTLIKAADGMTTASADGDLIRLTSCDGVTIHNLDFDGNASKRGGFATEPQSLRLMCSNDTTITGCHFRAAVCDDLFIWSGVTVPPSPGSAGYTPVACQFGEVGGCTFESPLRDGISLVGAAFFRVSGCTFRNVNATNPANYPGWAPAGIDVESNSGDPVGSCHDLYFFGNTFINCFEGITAKFISRPTGLRIVGNTLDNCTYPINSEAADVEIFDNTINGGDPTKPAIASDNGGSARINFNRITGRGATPIYVESGNTVGTNFITV